MEGFDVRTGATTWSLALGPAEAFMDEDIDATAVSDSEVLVQGATGPVIVDLGRGSTRTPGKGEAFWCTTNVIFDYREPRHLPNGATSNSRRGETRLDPCAADGSPTTAVPVHLAKALGATVGDRTVVATSRGLVAYDRARSRS
jgi:hypothetical protein